MSNRKRNFISDADQERMIQNFIDELSGGEIDPQFHDEPREFIGEEDIDFVQEDSEEDDEEDAEEVVPIVPRKIIYKSLDEVTNLDKYDPLPTCTENQRIFYNTKDGKKKTKLLGIV